MNEKVHNQSGAGRFRRLVHEAAKRLVSAVAPIDARRVDELAEPAWPAWADRVRQLDEELRSARSQLARYGESLGAIRRSILPQRLPNVPGLDLAVHFADADGPGGDYYDVRPVGPDHWAIVIADVSGHDLAAAAIVALVHALGSGLQDQDVPRSPGEALAAINRPLATRYLVDTGKFVTAFVGLYDVRRRVLSYSSAGHPPARLVRGKELQRLDAACGLPLSVDLATVYDTETVKLLPGDRLVLFTDGITESRNAAQEFYSDTRLDAVLCAPASTADEMLSSIVGSVRAFRARQPTGDDETCLVAVVKSDAEHSEGDRRVHDGDDHQQSFEVA